jgi:hypothetical protein
VNAQRPRLIGDSRESDCTLVRGSASSAAFLSARIRSLGIRGRGTRKALRAAFIEPT